MSLLIDLVISVLGMQRVAKHQLFLRRLSVRRSSWSPEWLIKHCQIVCRVVAIAAPKKKVCHPRYSVLIVCFPIILNSLAPKTGHIKAGRSDVSFGGI